MQATKLGGLNGKARMLRQRSRASQFHARQLLDEYLEPDPFVDRPARYIPIRSRNDFLPAVSVWRAESANTGRAGECGVQLDLPFNLDVPMTLDAGKISPAEPLQLNDRPARKWARPRAAFQIAPGPKGTRGFDLTRFAYGFLLGGAAAAVVLLVVLIAVG